MRSNTLHLAGAVHKSNIVGGLGEMLIEKQTRHVGLYLILLTAMYVKLYKNRMYVSSTWLTMIVDDEQIPVLKQFKSDDSWLKNCSRQIAQAATFHCVVRIDKIRMKRGWNCPSCGGEKCKKGNLDRKHGRFWCDSCHSSVDYLVLIYKLELEVSDDTAQAVVVMFDETARTVVKCLAGSIDEEDTTFPSALVNIMGTVYTLELKSNSYYEHTNYERFTCWIVVLEDVLDESGSFGTLVASGGLKTDVDYNLIGYYSVKADEKHHNSDGEESFVADSKTKGSDVDCSSKAGKK
nr:hypothetical protein [Tanacetum cinerariifolium]